MTALRRVSTSGAVTTLRDGERPGRRPRPRGREGRAGSRTTRRASSTAFPSQESARPVRRRAVRADEGEHGAGRPGVVSERTRRVTVRPTAARALIVAALVGGLVLGGLALKVLHGKQPTFEGEKRTLLGDTKASLLPGTPSLALRRDSLYWPHDTWTAYLADERTCPGGERTDLPLAEQANVMVCLVNYARAKRGLAKLWPVALLNGTSLAKADRIVRCEEFKHAACGDDPATTRARRGTSARSGRISTSPTAVPGARRQGRDRRLAQLTRPSREPVPPAVAHAGHRRRDDRQLR